MNALVAKTCVARPGLRTAGKPVVVMMAIAPQRTLRTGIGCSRYYLRHGELSAHRKCRRIACQGGEAVVEEEDKIDFTSTNSGGVSQPAAEDALKELPEGNLVYTEPGQFQKLCTSLKLIFAVPWRRFKKGSVLSMQLEGDIQEVLPGMFSSAVSLPAVCECLTKAAYDPRVSGLFIKVGTLECGWGKVLEIRRHIELFRKSGKFTIGYMERGNEKEYFLLSACEEVYLPPSGTLGLRGLSVSGTFVRAALDKIGVEPQVRRIGKYKSAGDQLLREDMSEPQKEQLSALLEDLYTGFVDGVAKSRGKTEEQVTEMLENGFIDMKSFKEGGWVTDLKYMDELIDLVKERQKVKKKEKVKKVTLRRYTSVSPSAFGLNGRQAIAIVRASGVIVGNVRGMQANFISTKSLIPQIQRARDNKAVKAIVIRVDSPGGDALASDLMWREIQKAAEEKPVVASMSDVAASGGYYLSMAANKVIAEALTLTGSIGVVLGKFSLEELYKKIGVGKEILSKGKYAELFSDNRSFSQEEDDYFTQLAEHAYEEFRNKAAECRGMEPDEMQALAQGRVWSGRRASEVGLVDAVGGISRAIAVAKEAAKIPPETPVRLLELSRKRGSPLEAFQGAGAVSGDVASALFVMFGLGSMLMTQRLGERIEGIFGAVLGLLGLLGPRLNAQQSDVEYLMEDVNIDNDSSMDCIPQAIMDDVFLDKGNITSSHLRDLISKIL